MRILFIIFGVVSLLLGCSPNENESKVLLDTQIMPQEKFAPESVEINFDASCEAGSLDPVESRLDSILRRLAKSENRYALKNRRSIDIKESIFYGIKTISEFSSQNTTYKVSNFDHLIEQILKSESVFIKGTKDISITGNSGFYARAEIEEYVFSSLDCAKTAESYLGWINKHGPWGGSYHKAPSETIRRGQTVYYTYGHGEFMRGYMPEIVSVIEESGE